MTEFLTCSAITNDWVVCEIAFKDEVPSASLSSSTRVVASFKPVIILFVRISMTVGGCGIV